LYLDLYHLNEKLTMRKHLIILIFLNILILSCEKDKEYRELNNRLIGKWFLTSSCGGITGDCWYPDENSDQVAFSRRMEFIRTQYGEIVRKTSYYFVDSSAIVSAITFRIRLEDDNESVDGILSGETLSLCFGDVWNNYKKN
jgi:hypothetical protein